MLIVSLCHALWLTTHSFGNNLATSQTTPQFIMHTESTNISITFCCQASGVCKMIFFRHIFLGGNWCYVCEFLCPFEEMSAPLIHEVVPHQHLSSRCLPKQPLKPGQIKAAGSAVMICGLLQILNNDINSCPPVRLFLGLHHDEWPPVSTVWLQAVCFAARCIGSTLPFSSFLHFKHPIYFLYEMDLVDWIIFTVGGSLWAWKWNEVPNQSWTGTTSEITITFSSNRL